MSNSESIEFELKRFEMWVGLAKFVIGTVIMGLVSLFLNYQYQQNQLDLEREKSKHAIELQDKQAEFEYLSKFMKHAMNEDLNVRIRLANYMQSAALSENIKGIWARYHALLTEQQTDALERRDQLQSEELALASQLAELTSEEVVSRDKSIKRLGEIQMEINYVQDQLDRRKYGSFQDNNVDIGAALREAEDARHAGNIEQELKILLISLESAGESLRWYILSSISSAYRSMRDFENAELYAQRAVSLKPENAGALVRLAIMQKNKGSIDLAVRTLKRAEPLSENHDRSNVQLITAGYLIHAGKRQEGMLLFEKIREGVESDTNLATNLAWFRAVAGPEEDFYQALERALTLSPDNGTLQWIDVEVDLDRYREEPRFIELLDRFDNR
jgi:Flp pilus assembly protein TadD